MRVFVTGGTGFIGSSLVRRLRSEDHEVIVLTRSEEARRRVLQMDALPVKGDIIRPGFWQDEVPFADVVIHAAAYVSDWAPRRHDFYRLNVDGTRNILNAMNDWGGHFIHLSSIAVHGFRPGTYTENSPPNRNRHPYCDSKAAAERLVDMAVAAGLKASLVRIAGVYGPGDPHIITRLLDQAKSSRIYFVGKGNQPANLIYIDDVIDGLMLIFKRECVPGSRYLLSQPKALDVQSLIRYAVEALKLDVRIQRVPMGIAYPLALWQEICGRLFKTRPSFTRYAVRAMGNSCFFSTDITEKKLGWSPRVSILEGIARTIAGLENS